MSSSRNEFDSLFSLYVIVAAVVATLVFGAVAFAVLRYRHRKGNARTPSQRRGAGRLEVGYAIVVAAVIAVVLTRTLSTESSVDATPSRSSAEGTESLVVNVLAFQWGWRFSYPEADFSVVGDDLDPPVLTVPLDRRISFSLRARDVIHAFWVPSQRFKRDAIPGRVNRFDLIFDEAGRQPGLCAEFCGLRHADMRFEVEVLPGDEFDAWLSRQQSASEGRPRPRVEVTP